MTLPRRFAYAVLFSTRTAQLEMNVESTMGEFVDFANGLIAPIEQLLVEIPAAESALLRA
jgi:hypothetical protein